MSSTTGRWTTIALGHPQPVRRLRYDDVLVHGGRLWWIDIASCHYSLDPLLDHPILQFIALPLGYICNRRRLPLFSEEVLMREY
jgi:hypothetical protein